MGSTEITALRKKGLLDDALEMALKEHAEKPQDMYITSALAWVYRDKLKDLEANEFQSFFDNFNNILELDLHLENEIYLLPALLWAVNNMGWNLINAKSDTQQRLRELLRLAVQLPAIKSEPNSIVVKMFVRGFKSDKSAYYQLVNWQGFDNFISAQDNILDKNENAVDDFKGQKYEGILQPALAENYFGTYCKHLISDMGKNNAPILIETVQAFLPYLEKLIEFQPNYKWLPYYLPLLYYGIGEIDTAKQLMISFIKTHTNDYWAWKRLGDICQEQEEKLSCYCRGMQCSAPPEKLVGIRRGLIPLFLAKSDFGSAKYELLQLVDSYEKKNWPIRGLVKDWLNSQWFKNNEANKNNSSVYEMYASQAEDILYGSVEPKSIIITWQNKEKKLAGFEIEGIERTDGKIHGPITLQLNPFDTYSVKLISNKNGSFEVVSNPIPFANLQFRREFVREVEGVVRIHRTNNFGFIEDQFGDVYVPSEIVKELSLSDGDPYSGYAVKNWNAKKGKWGWKVYEDIDFD